MPQNGTRMAFKIKEMKVNGNCKLEFREKYNLTYDHLGLDKYRLKISQPKYKYSAWCPIKGMLQTNDRDEAIDFAKQGTVSQRLTTCGKVNRNYIYDGTGIMPIYHSEI